MSRILALRMYHLTCHQVPAEDDPPEMTVINDPDHAFLAKYTCPKCNHKVTIDMVVNLVTW